MKLKIRSPSFCNDTLADNWNIGKKINRADCVDRPVAFVISFDRGNASNYLFVIGVNEICPFS